MAVVPEMSPSGRNNTGGRGRRVAASAGRVVVGGRHGGRVGAGGGRLGAGSGRGGLVKPDNSHGSLVEPDNSHGGRSNLGQATSHGGRVAATVGRGSGVVSSNGAAATDGRSYGPGGGAFSRGGGGTAEGCFPSTDGSSARFPFSPSPSAPWWEAGTESISPSFKRASAWDPSRICVNIANYNAKFTLGGPAICNLQ
ncbi:hypothetical protein E2562_009410 [Oryza meyeriana var. granulata]|uniref:Uncharacterized protein n=1 Tax=Oryza meyeriana var. granulata TaxID=110450 RepID=A0A6G1BTS8_9ORYZ|nr:hypothetical protein E2562_009410 [Oryza meyeriana var. granulata]